MSYRFNLNDTIEQNVRRIALEQIDRALAPTEASDGIWVHETRKSIKRVRALFRLIRSGLPEADWRRRNNELRDIAKLLSGKRDSDVRRSLIAEMEIGAKPKLAAALRSLSEFEDKASASQKLDPTPTNLNGDSAIDAAKLRLKKVRRLCARTKISDDIAHIICGLTETHRAGRRWLDVVKLEPADEDFHELRKAVQVHWRQMLLLTDTWPAALQLRASTAKEIAQSLGTEHDLTMLMHTIDALPRGALSKSERSAIRNECQARQASLRTNSIAEAERLFTQKPKIFADEIGAYWQLVTRKLVDADH